MKRTLSTIALAVLTVGLLGSCAKINERLDGLDKRIDGLENERIASIESQIGSINSSIADLGTIRSNIQSLTTTAESQGKDITDLQAADKALGERIDNLKKYVNDTLKSYATAQWVEATFVTLEQYKATCDTIAMIDAKLSETSEQLSKDIKACSDSLTKWINKTFEGYYTAAKMDAELAKLKAAIDTASGVSEKTTDSIKTELKKAEVAIDTAKAQITRQYTSAIATAITTSEGKLTKAIQDSIATVNGRIDDLAEEVTKLNSDVTDLLGRVSALEEMIQSVTIVPSCVDGSIELVNDIFTVNCIISPASAATNLKKKDFKILLNKVLTKSVSLDTVYIEKDTDLEITKDGRVSIKADIYDYIPAGQDSSLTVAVNVEDGTSDYTTEFVKVKGSYSYVKITAKYDGEDKPARTLKWAKENLAISESGKKEWKGSNRQHPTGHIVGDFFQWGAYVGYCGNPDDTDKGLLIYEEFTHICCEEVPGSPFSIKLKSDPNGKKYIFGDTPEREDEEAYAPYLISKGKYSKYTGIGDEKDGKTILEPNDDVANIILGGSWRIPNSSELDGLVKATYWAWDLGDRGFYLFAPQGAFAAGDNATSIPEGLSKDRALLFFPAAGHGHGTGFSGEGSEVYFWASNVVIGTSIVACGRDFWEGTIDADYYNSYRYHGFSIRPVAE